jgi:DNA-binding NarL/FixJ family response regulator
MATDHSHIPSAILVVEDEMMIRMDTVDLVEDAGYTLVEAADADDAVAILESRSDIALMVTDIRKHGRIAACSGGSRALAIDQIIVVSGQLTQPHGLPADSCFFGKPLEAQDMISQMRSMIGHA